MAKPTLKKNPCDALYKPQLEAMAYIVGEDGACSRLVKDGKSVPITVEDKPLYLPTPELLERNKWDMIQPYHPLSENTLRGQSPVIHKLVRDLEVWTTIQLYSTVEMIIKVATTPELQTDLVAHEPRVSEILAECGVGADEKVVKQWTTLRRQLSEAKFRPLRIYLDRKYEEGDVKFSRVAIVTKAILEDMDVKNAKIQDISVGSKVNKATIMGILNYVLKPIEKLYGSNAMVPYYHVFLQVQRDLIKRFNYINEAFTSRFDYIPVDETWFDCIDNLESFGGFIPPLPGNEGVQPTRESRSSGYNEDDMYESSTPPKREERKEEPREERREERREDRGYRGRNEERRNESRGTMSDYLSGGDRDRDRRDRYDDYDDDYGYGDRRRDRDRRDRDRGRGRDRYDDRRDRRDRRDRDRDRYDDRRSDRRGGGGCLSDYL